MTDWLETDEIPGRTLAAGGTEYLYFSGTSYLGMARQAAFLELLQEELIRYGTNYSSSRLSNVQLAVFGAAEARLATITGAPAALTLCSGYLAGQLVVRELISEAAFIYAPRTHPALWRSPEDFYDGNFDEWANNLADKINREREEQVVVLINSLDPLLVRQYPMDWVSRLPAQKRITLVIDDSHGLGVTGREGGGIFGEVPRPQNVRLVVVSSLGKALGIPAGVILSDPETIAAFRQSPFFGGGSPAVPAFLAAFNRATAVYRDARQQLQNNIRFFLSQLQDPGNFSFIPEYPVFYTSASGLYAYLLERGILLSSFSYPTPDSPRVTRIVLNSLHTRADLELLAREVNQYFAAPGS